MPVTDPAWGVRVFGFAGSAVIAVLLGLDLAPRPPDATHLATIVVCLLCALLCARLPKETTRRLAALALPASPVLGCINITIAMRVAESASTAMALSLLYGWFATFCALYGRRWHTVLSLALTGPGLCVGLWEQIGGFRAAVFALSAVAVLSVSTLVLAVVSEQVRRASTTDSLTGAVSRRGLTERAPGFALRHRGRHRGVAVVVLDLDGFKTYNDVHGHAAGDALLVEAVRAWRRVLPAASLLARTGGDEFVALVTTSAVGAAADADLLDDLRRAAPDGVRASAGSAPWPVGTTLESATHEADRAMYLDKGDRRRGAVAAPPAGPPNTPAVVDQEAGRAAHPSPS
ncbi:GGDEF domain-containing protein [Quadrisphaera setariae]|uniref:GGDEF domain-containing protein n=1 Tax=Quadrisphaera setariae TaxID=2593304 RepID=A0A5C8ZF82_9ACTN|nr:GGDEF domain-containing protein [Quadrisphaera setariae]TXR56144.1 GGDEF domain-containing protein [Quadrisphaera setariae]